jgi:ABC-2 type transport system ATP-binding protein
MQEPIIAVERLRKVYRVPVREKGLLPSVKALIHPVYNNVTAVDNINFQINRGEIVGFIGPNGAGKTTTLKMLSGLLYPTEGNTRVAGYIPYERQRDYLKTISMVMGNKSQLIPSITVMDSFYITKEIYQISSEDFKARLEELSDLLEIEDLLNKLPRNLSLGERAKCEFAAALLYRPDILFLDEPTLGMDVSIQIRLRKFIKDYNKKYGTTIILTSHYMEDITSLCNRTIFINKGKLMYDGSLEELSRKLSPYKLIKATFKEELQEVSALLPKDSTLTEKNGLTYIFRVNKEEISETAGVLLRSNLIIDLTIENPSIEAVIDKAYQEGV